MSKLLISLLILCSSILSGANNTASNEFSLAFGNRVSVTDSYTVAIYDSLHPGKVKISDILYLHPLENLPATGNMGEICVTDDGKLWFYNGTAWKEVVLVP